MLGDFSRSSLAGAIAVGALLGAATNSWAVTAGQVDDFENGTTMLWSEGGASPNPPTNVATGGPDGANDNFLRNVATGGAGSGSKMTMFNIAQWNGDYIAEGVTEIRFQARVSQGGPLNLRVAFGASTGSQFSSTTAVVVANDGAWHDVVLPIGEADLTRVSGAASHAASMAVVTEMRIISSAAPAWRGDAVSATLDVDNIEAFAPTTFAGWLWEFGVLGTDTPDLTEENCFAPLQFDIEPDDNWTATGNDDACWGRITTNSNPPRAYFNYDGVNILSTESFVSQSTQPLASAGGNLLEVYGEDVEMGVGQGESRFGTVLAEPSDSDLLILGSVEKFFGPTTVEFFGALDLLVKSSAGVNAARTTINLEGRWYVSEFRRSPDDSDPDTEIATATVLTLDLQANGICTFVESGVFQHPSFSGSLATFFATQFPVPGSTSVADRAVEAGVATANATSCSYSINADEHLELTYNDGMTAVTEQYVVSDDDNYFIWAPATPNPDIVRNSLRLGYRAPTAMAAGALDGTFLFYLNEAEFLATGLGHSAMNTGLQEYDGFGRGRLRFDSTTPRPVPAGQGGSWFDCDMDLAIDAAEYRVEGDFVAGTVAGFVDVDAEQINFSDCQYSLAADGALLVELEFSEQGSAPATLLLEGYANVNGEVLSLLHFQTEPDPVNDPGTEDQGVVRHVLGMRYTGDVAGDEDLDGTTNFDEFVEPVPPPTDLHAIGALPDLNGNGSGEIAVTVEGGSRVHIRDGATDVLISDIAFSGDPALDFAIVPDLDASGDPEVAILGERPNGQIRALVKDSISGATTGNAFFGLEYSGIQMIVVPDFSGNGLPELAVLGTEPTADRIRVQLRDAATNAGIKSLFLGNRFAARNIVALSDVTGNGIPEIATIGAVKATNQVMAPVRDADTTALHQTVFWANQFEPVATTTIADINASGAPEIVSLGYDPVTGAGRLQVRDASNRTPITTVFLGTASAVLDLEVVNDTNSNGFPDLAVLSLQGNGAGLVRIYDSDTGNLLRNVFYNTLDGPLDMAILADYSGNGQDEVAVLGQSAGVRQVQVKDAGTGLLVNAIDFP